MKLTKIILVISGLFIVNVQAEEMCFIAMNANTGEIVAKKGTICDTRISPMSTFKIPISLMGFQSRVLQDETHPEWAYQPRPDGIEVDKEKQIPYTPKTWMAESIVWYSQALTPKIGEANFKRFVEQFDYGNKDISGDKGKGNGLTNAWLSSSLKISPYEQLVFLRKIVNRKLPLTPHTYEMTQNILYVDDIEGGWKYYGKTGKGEEFNADGTPNMDKQFGWFVGWIQKGDHKTVFAFNMKDAKAVPSMKERQMIAKAYLKEFGLLQEI